MAAKSSNELPYKFNFLSKLQLTQKNFDRVSKEFACLRIKV